MSTESHHRERAAPTAQPFLAEVRWRHADTNVACVKITGSANTKKFSGYDVPGVHTWWSAGAGPIVVVNYFSSMPLTYANLPTCFRSFDHLANKPCVRQTTPKGSSIVVSAQHTGHFRDKMNSMIDISKQVSDPLLFVIPVSCCAELVDKTRPVHLDAIHGHRRHIVFVQESGDRFFVEGGALQRGSKHYTVADILSMFDSGPGGNVTVDITPPLDSEHLQTQLSEYLQLTCGSYQRSACSTTQTEVTVDLPGTLRILGDFIPFIDTNNAVVNGAGGITASAGSNTFNFKTWITGDEEPWSITAMLLFLPDAETSDLEKGLVVDKTVDTAADVVASNEYACRMGGVVSEIVHVVKDGFRDKNRAFALASTDAFSSGTEYDSSVYGVWNRVVDAANKTWMSGVKVPAFDDSGPVGHDRKKLRVHHAAMLPARQGSVVTDKKL